MDLINLDIVDNSEVTNDCVPIDEGDIHIWENFLNKQEKFLCI